MNARPASLFVGAANLDRNARLAAPHEWATYNRATITSMVGGVCFNIASRFAACGGKATLVTALGPDAAGAEIKHAAKERNVLLETSEVVRTGAFLSILEPDGNLVTAISDMAGIEAFRPVLPRGSYDWMVLDSNLSEAVIDQLGNEPDSRLALATASVSKAPRIATALANADIVFTNMAELGELSGGAADPFGWFRTRTDAVLVATDGPRPLQVLTGQTRTAFPVHPCEYIVDVMGAGDALAGTMLYSLASGASIADAVSAGLLAAAQTLQVEGPYLPPER